MAPLLVMLTSGSLLLAGALLVSEIAEAYQFELCDSLVASVVSLVQTLPEYAICVVSALGGRFDLSFASLIGANLLLVCLGYPLVMFVAYAGGVSAVRKDRSIDMMRVNSVEGVFLLISGIYLFTIAIKGSINALDAILLTSIYGSYVLAVTKIPPEVELERPKGLAGLFLRRKRLGLAVGIAGSILIVVLAEPFLHAAIEVAEGLPWMTTFLMVAVLTPLLSEMPEKVTALNMARESEDMARMGLLNMMSSKVNNGLLLPSTVAVVAIARSFRHGHATLSLSVVEFRMDLAFAAAITIFAATTVINRRFTLREAFYLVPLYAVAILIQHPSVLEAAPGIKLYATIVALLASLGEVAYAAKQGRVLVFDDLRHAISLMRRESTK